MHAPSGIRTHDLSRQAAVDLRLRPRGYWDRLLVTLLREIFGATDGEGAGGWRQNLLRRIIMCYFTVCC